MHELTTAILRHDTGRGMHFDWLLQDPDQPPGHGLLATMRLPLEPWRWPRCGSLTMVGHALPPHRRRYLTYQGPIGDGRRLGPQGSVTRVDRGTALALRWTSEVRLVALRTRCFVGLLRCERLSGNRWRATASGIGDRPRDGDGPDAITRWLRGL